MGVSRASSGSSGATEAKTNGSQAQALTIFSTQSVRSTEGMARPGPPPESEVLMLPEVAFGIWMRPSQHSASVIAGVSKRKKTCGSTGNNAQAL